MISKGTGRIGMVDSGRFGSSCQYEVFFFYSGNASGILCLYAIIKYCNLCEQKRSDQCTHCPLEECHKHRSISEILLVDHLQTGNKMH